MKPQYNNLLISSFMEFLDHRVCDYGEAYSQKSGALQKTKTHPKYGNFPYYQSSARQFVYDNSVSNPCSGVIVNGAFIPNGTSGCCVNYKMGGVFFTGTYTPPASATISANYAQKDFNIYYSESRDEEVIFDAKYNIGKTGIIQFDDLIYPAIFVKSTYEENEPFAFGGLDSTTVTLRCVVMTDNPYMLDAATSILRDSARTVFPLLSPADTPLGYFGQIKNPPFSYNSLCESYQTSGGQKLVQISSVNCSKFKTEANDVVGENFYGAFVDFDVVGVRNSRQKGA